MNIPDYKLQENRVLWQDVEVHPQETTHRPLLVERQQAKAATLMKTSLFVLHGGAVMKEMRLP